MYLNQSGPNAGEQTPPGCGARRPAEHIFSRLGVLGDLCGSRLCESCPEVTHLSTVLPSENRRRTEQRSNPVYLVNPVKTPFRVIRVIRGLTFRPTNFTALTLPNLLISVRRGKRRTSVGK